jgi:hypothetical protein
MKSKKGTNQMKLNEAETIVGGLSKTSKMPTDSISLSAELCSVGQKLRKVPGSVCSKCYACKGAYNWRPVKAALQRRLEGLDDPMWVDAMVTLLKGKKRIKDSGLFRWHDSGDLQSEDHLRKILAVAEATPEIIHWIPTKEKGLVKRYFALNSKPKNVVIRLSGAMIDGDAPTFEHTSTVTSDPAKATCRAFENDGECGTCRKCWDFNVKNVTYLAH